MYAPSISNPRKTEKNTSNEQNIRSYYIVNHQLETRISTLVTLDLVVIYFNAKCNAEELSRTNYECRHTLHISNISNKEFIISLLLTF